MKRAKRLSEHVEAILQQLGPESHPLRILLQIASRCDIPLETRIDAAARALPYCAPRLQSTEISGPEGTPLHGATFVDQLAVIQHVYSAAQDPAKRAQLVEALMLPPASEAHDEGA